LSNQLVYYIRAGKLVLKSVQQSNVTVASAEYDKKLV